MGVFFSPSRLYFLWNVVACPPRSLKLHQAGARGAIIIWANGDTEEEAFEQSMERLELVLERLEWAGLRAKPSKCHLFATSVDYLGHVCSRDGVSLDPKKISAVANINPRSINNLETVERVQKHVSPFSGDVCVPLPVSVEFQDGVKGSDDNLSMDHSDISSCDFGPSAVGGRGILVSERVQKHVSPFSGDVCVPLPVSVEFQDGVKGSDDNLSMDHSDISSCDFGPSAVGGRGILVSERVQKHVSPFSGDVCVPLPVSVEFQDGVKGSDDNLSMDHSDISSCDFGPSAVGGRGILVSERVQKHVSPFSGDVCVPLPVSVEFQDGVKGSDDNLSMDHSDISSCDFGPSAVGGRGILVSERVQKHVSPFSGDVCVPLPVSVEFQDGVKGSDDNLSMDHSDISSCDFGPSAVGGRGILVSERVQKHVSPFSGDVCVPLPVSVEFQDGVKGSDDNLSMDHSDISSCDFGPSAVGGRGILVSERVQKHVSPFSGDVCVPLPVSVEFQDGVKGSDDNLSMDHSDISSCDFGPSAVGGRGILVSERVQKHVSPFSGDVCVPLPVSVEFQDGVKGSDDNLSMDHSDISSCDFGPSAVGGRGILVSERVQKHVSPFSGDVCVPLPVSVEFQDGVKGSDDNLSMDHSDISSCDFGPSAVGGRGILVSERVQKHVSPFSGDVCVPLPVSVEFQDGVKGSDDNLSMDHSDISSCDFGPSAVGGRGILVSERVQKHVSPFSGDVCVPLPVSVEFQDGVKGSDDNLSMDHSDISSCDFGPSAVGGRGILVSERVQKHVSPFSGDVCVPLPVSVEFQDGVKGSDDNLSMDHSDISSCDFGPSAVGGRGILVSERVQKHVSPFSGDVCVPLPVSVEFQDGVKGSDDNLSMDHSDISSCDFGPSAVGGRGILVSERVQKHVSPFSGDVCVPLPVSVEFQDGVKGSDDNLSMDHSDISSCDFGPSAVGGRGILVSERVQKHVSPFSGDVCVPLPVSVEFQDGVKGSDDNLSMDHSDISSCDFGPSAVGGRGILVSERVQKHVSPFSGDVCVPLPVSVEFQDGVKGSDDNLSMDHSDISSCDFGPSAVGGRGILVSERVQKHVSPFSGDVCVPLPVSVEFQDGVKGSDDNLSMDHSDISSCDFGPSAVGGRGILVSERVQNHVLGTANGGPKSCLAIAKAFETWEPLYARYA